MRRTALAYLALASVFAPPALGAEPSGYSGMVKISAESFLVVNDRKNPIHTGERLGVLTVTPRDGLLFSPLTTDWGGKDKVPSDLEGCCALPGRPSEYLLVESGQYKKQFGRAFHVRVDRDKEGAWQAKALKAFALPQPPPDEFGSTPDADQVEGVGCMKVGDKLILALGRRGGKVKAGTKVSRLVWGELDLEKYRFGKLGEDDLVAESVLGQRDCGDLYLQAKGDEWAVWSVATRDDGDSGPFRSAVYRAGTFVADDKAVVRFVREPKPADVVHVAGFKVEGLAAPAASLKESLFSIATDDENFGGVWRPLFGKR